jgi:uroporphyrinogen-III synthase
MRTPESDAATRGPLAGTRVLVTRPAAQARALCRAVEALGGEAVALPAVAIRPPEAPEEARRRLLETVPADLLVFTSRNAVGGALALLDGRTDSIAEASRAAIGAATADSLARADLPADLVCSGRQRSEDLLAEPALEAVKGRRVLLVTGAGGRRVLAETLTARGARVEVAEVYRRVLPEAGADRLQALLVGEALDVAVVTSGECLGNLQQLAGEAAPWLLRLPLVVISPRLAALARERGARLEPVVAERASDEALMAALVAWRRGVAGRLR